MLTFTQKSSLRRHLGYPVVGLLQTSPAGGTVAGAFAGYRFFQTYGRMEWKMNNLNPDEEARLTGNGYGAVALIGPQPTTGDTIGITLSGGNIASPQTLTATAQAVGVGQDARIGMVLQLAAAASRNTVLAEAGIMAPAPYGTGPFNENAVPLPEVSFVAPFSFAVSNPTGSGILVPVVTATGALLPPTASLDGVTTIWGYLPILDGLETAYAEASQNLDTSRAGPWQARQSELSQRLSLYRNWQVRLQDFLEIPIYNGHDAPPRQSYVGSLRYL
jgi:hypothetical protein